MATATAFPPVLLETPETWGQDSWLVTPDVAAEMAGDLGADIADCEVWQQTFAPHVYYAYRMANCRHTRYERTIAPGDRAGEYLTAEFHQC